MTRTSVHEAPYFRAGDSRTGVFDVELCFSYFPYENALQRLRTRA